ncbi:MAG: TetR/AcrR family transcriptional regulator [Terracidiphilus sp.]
MKLDVPIRAPQRTSSQPSEIGRRERRAAATRLRLFRCALRLFAKRGFQNVTVEDVTEAADVGKGTFFNYFESKDHVLGVMAEIQLGKVREAAARVHLGNQPIYTVLHRLAQRLAEEPGRSPGLARAFISSFLTSPSVREILKRNMQEGRKAIGRLIAEGQRRGEIDPRLKPAKVAPQFLQTCIGSVLLWSLHEKPALGVWIDDSFQHFWRSIANSRKKKAS